LGTLTSESVETNLNRTVLKSRQKAVSDVKAVSVNSKLFHDLALATGKDMVRRFKN